MDSGGRGVVYIVCMYYGDGGQYDGTEIMTDCGDSVLQEMEWFLEKASLICQGKYTGYFPRIFYFGKQIMGLLFN